MLAVVEKQIWLLMGAGSNIFNFFSQKYPNLKILNSVFYARSTLDFEIMQEFMVYCDDTGTF